MADRFTNTVRNRLYKKGCQGFTKQEFIDCAIAIGVEDMNNPSQEELSKAVDYLINNQSQITEVIETLQKLEEEPMQDENNGEITFTNSFEKAGAIQKAFEDNGIVASDVEAVTISGRLIDSFESHSSFIVEALQAWREYRLEEESKEADKVQRLLADIRTDSVVATNKISESINATAEFINGIRAKQREEFMSFIKQVRNG